MDRKSSVDVPQAAHGASQATEAKESAKSDAELYLESLEKEKEFLESRCKWLERKMTTGDEQKKELEKDLAAVKVELDRAKALNGVLKKEKENLWKATESQLSDAVKRVDSLASDLKNSEVESHLLKAEVKQLKIQLGDASKRVSDITRELKDSGVKCSQLEAENKTLKTAVAAKDEEISRLNADKERVDFTMAEHLKAMDELYQRVRRGIPSSITADQPAVQPMNFLEFVVPDLRTLRKQSPLEVTAKEVAGFKWSLEVQKWSGCGFLSDEKQIDYFTYMVKCDVPEALVVQMSYEEWIVGHGTGAEQRNKRTWSDVHLGVGGYFNNDLDLLLLADVLDPAKGYVDPVTFSMTVRVRFRVNKMEPRVVPTSVKRKRRSEV